jgi:hypothetical protein
MYCGPKYNCALPAVIDHAMLPEVLIDFTPGVGRGDTLSSLNAHKIQVRTPSPRPPSRQREIRRILLAKLKASVLVSGMYYSSTMNFIQTER